MDSPGYCAKYCTYTFMEHNSNEVIHAEVVDKRETGGNSNAMETKGFNRGLAYLLQLGLNIVEVVTDQHTSISACISKLHIVHIEFRWYT